MTLHLYRIDQVSVQSFQISFWTKNFDTFSDDVCHRPIRVRNTCSDSAASHCHQQSIGMVMPVAGICRASIEFDSPVRSMKRHVYVVWFYLMCHNWISVMALSLLNSSCYVEGYTHCCMLMLIRLCEFYDNPVVFGHSNPIYHDQLLYFAWKEKNKFQKFRSISDDKLRNIFFNFYFELMPFSLLSIFTTFVW